MSYQVVLTKNRRLRMLLQSCIICNNCLTVYPNAEFDSFGRDAFPLIIVNIEKIYLFVNIVWITFYRIVELKEIIQRMLFALHSYLVL